MISEFTPPDVKIVGLRTGAEIVAGRVYTTRGMVLNRHWKTREPDAHVLLREVTAPRGQFGERGYPRDAFEIATWPQIKATLETAA